MKENKIFLIETTMLLGMLLQNLKKTIIFSLEIIFALDSRIFCKKKLGGGFLEVKILGGIFN